MTMAAFILIKLSDDDSFIIGEVHNETEEDIVLKYPIVMRLRTTVNQTTNVTTSKFLPFSENNIVALKKCALVGFTKPNEKIIKYYLRFLQTFQSVLDNDLENDICGLQDDSNLNPLDYEEEDEEVVPSLPMAPMLH
jgi:hypothetical protein